MTKRKLKLGYIIGGIAMIFIALLLVKVIHSQITGWNEFKKTALSTTATITDIQRRRTGSKKHRKTSYTVYIKYTVDDTEYENILGYYVKGMYEGQTVDILYDPANPSHHESQPYVPAAIEGILAVVLLLLGAASLRSEIYKYFYINQLIAEDSYVICDQWQDLRSNTSVNNVRYHYTECTYTDERGVTYTFGSDIYHPNKQPFVPGDRVKVYVDLQKPTKYYVSYEKVQDETYL